MLVTTTSYTAAAPMPFPDPRVCTVPRRTLAFSCQWKGGGHATVDTFHRSPRMSPPHKWLISAIGGEVETLDR